MASCKECIHFDRCKGLYKFDRLQKAVSKGCSYFKDRVLKRSVNHETDLHLSDRNDRHGYRRGCGVCRCQGLQESGLLDCCGSSERLCNILKGEWKS